MDIIIFFRRLSFTFMIAMYARVIEAKRQARDHINTHDSMNIIFNIKFLSHIWIFWFKTNFYYKIESEFPLWIY